MSNSVFRAAVELSLQTHFEYLCFFFFYSYLLYTLFRFGSNFLSFLSSFFSPFLSLSMCVCLFVCFSLLLVVFEPGLDTFLGCSANDTIKRLRLQQTAAALTAVATTFCLLLSKRPLYYCCFYCYGLFFFSLTACTHACVAAFLKRAALYDDYWISNGRLTVFDERRLQQAVWSWLLVYLCIRYFVWVWV